MKIFKTILGFLLLFVLSKNLLAFECSHRDKKDCELVNLQIENAYNEALNFVKDKEKLKKDQDEWEKSYSECKDEECKNKSLSERHFELSKIQIDGYDVIDKPLNDEEIKEVCSNIANLKDTPHSNGFRKYLLIDENSWQKVNNLYFKQGGVKSYKNVYEGGTCSSTNKISVDDDKLIESIEVDDPEDILRWAFWGENEVFALYKGRYYILSSGLNSVFLITPEYKKLPLCEMNEEEQNEIFFDYGTDKKVCDKFMEGAVKINPTNPSLIDKKDGILRYMGDFSTYVFDIDNDGNDDNIIMTDYASGAGCGGQETRVIKVNKYWSLEHDYDDIGFDDWASTSFYEIDGINYIYVFNRRRKTGYLAMRKGDEVEYVCNFYKIPKTTVKRYFKKI